VRAVQVVLGVLVLALGVAAGVLWSDLRALRGAETAGREAVAAAKAIAPELLSYDYRTVERDLARAGKHTTGALTRQYAELSGSLAAKARERRTIQTATVVAAAVERAETDRVEVLLFVNTGTVTGAEGKAEARQQMSRTRARFVMVRQDGRWLVSDLSTLIGTA
jgi:Mce-associated membrane protein